MKDKGPTKGKSMAGKRSKMDQNVKKDGGNIVKNKKQGNLITK